MMIRPQPRLVVAGIAAPVATKAGVRLRASDTPHVGPLLEANPAGSQTRVRRAGRRGATGGRGKGGGGWPAGGAGKSRRRRTRRRGWRKPTPAGPTARLTKDGAG